jgi:hypothetical protein
MNPRSLKNLRSWKKGQSGNPGGRPKKKPVLEALEQAALNNPKLLHKLAVNALKRAATDRGWFHELRAALDRDDDQEATGFDINVRFL